MYKGELPEDHYLAVARNSEVFRLGPPNQCSHAPTYNRALTPYNHIRRDTHSLIHR